VRWLSIVVVVAGALLVMWRRLAASNGVQMIASPVSPAVLTPPPVETTIPRRTLTDLLKALLRLLVFIGVAVALAWLMVNIPQPYSIIAFAIVLAAVLRQAWLLAVGAVGLTIASAVLFPDAIELWELEGPVLLMLLGGAALWTTMQLGWRLSRIPALTTPGFPEQLPARWSRTHIALFVLGLFALAQLIFINGRRFETASAISSTIDFQFLLLLSGVVLVVAGLGRATLPRQLPPIRWKLAFPLMGITALGLTVRFWQLHDTTRFFIDELFFADVMRYLWGWRYVPLTAPFDGIAAEPSLFPYWQSIAVETLGRNFVGMRAISVLIGALTLPSLYLLGRNLFDRRTALLAVVLLATFPPHLHFSRIGLSEIAMALFGTTAFAFLSRGVIANRRFDWVLGGAMLGMTHYFHEGGKYLFTPVAVAWLLGVWLFCRPRISHKSLLLAALACALVALPIYSTLLLTQKPLAARMVANGAGLDLDYYRQLFDSGNFREHILQHLTPPFLIYVQRPDSTLFYGGGVPLLLRFIAPAFLLGAFYVLRRWYSAGPMLLVLWVMGTSLGNTLLVDSANAARFVSVSPALTLLSAVGIRYILPLVWPENLGEQLSQFVQRRFSSVWAQRGSRLQDRLPDTAHVQFVVMLGLAVGLAAANVNYYFNLHIPVYNEQFRNNLGTRDPQDAVLRSLHFPAGTTIHIINPGDPPDATFTRGVLNFMADDLALYTLSANNKALPIYLAKLDHSIDHAFYVEPYDSATLELLRQRFDLLPPQTSPFDLPADHQYVLYYAPARSASPAG
jgi:hypothetical protein